MLRKALHSHIARISHKERGNWIMKWGDPSTYTIEYQFFDFSQHHVQVLISVRVVHRCGLSLVNFVTHNFMFTNIGQRNQGC